MRDTSSNEGNEMTRVYPRLTSRGQGLTPSGASGRLVRIDPRRQPWARVLRPPGLVVVWFESTHG
jgi:hypothetical protein